MAVSPHKTLPLTSSLKEWYNVSLGLLYRTLKQPRNRAFANLAIGTLFVKAAVFYQ